MPLLPYYQNLLDRLKRNPSKPYPELGIEGARKHFSTAAAYFQKQYPFLGSLAAIENDQMILDGRTLATRWYYPKIPSWGELQAVDLYFHGGGFCIGDLDTHHTICQRLAYENGRVILAVDYRLAPEYKFPAAVEDAWDSLIWLIKHAESYGVDPNNIGVMGDSAGGTLAAVVAILAAKQSITLTQQTLYYPGTTPRQDTQSGKEFATGYLLEKVTVDWFFKQYVLDESTYEDWRFAPINADLSQLEKGRLCPAKIITAEYDLLRDDAVLYAEKINHHTQVDLDVVAGVLHDFLLIG